MSKKKIEKKVSKVKKSIKSSCKSKQPIDDSTNQTREKVCGEPQKVCSLTKDKCANRGCPKLIFNNDSFWVKLQRFLRLRP